MNIIDELKNRKMFDNITNEEKFNKLSFGDGIYIGFDPTAKSLHLGNYMQITILKKFEKAGFKPFAVLGGATGMIGDPSGKLTERNLLDNRILLENKNAIRKQLEYFEFNIIDNLDFYKDMSALHFLRDVGKLLNINYMTSKDSVKSRLANGISFTEFSYQLIQAWDFKCLFEQHNVKMQVGGSDQWGNITSGVEVIRKSHGEAMNAVGITTKLLTTYTGEKFGKSAGNALFLDKNMTSPFEIYQYLLNISDSDVKRMLLYLTDYPIDKVDNIVNEHNKNKKLRHAQKELACQIIVDLHGEEEFQSCLKITNILFGQADVNDLKINNMSTIKSLIPHSTVAKNAKIIDVLISSGASLSKREAKEFINQNAVELNGEKIIDENMLVQPGSLFNGKASILKRGKNKFFFLEFTN
ncbi:tyrosine--tRNA ligase [Candidatus Mycoplasma mahonii]|uniref:tyrosine--tRNA ligase n=1 Tax=Candidatus Mycoplasma mahonii TaxID=3004105 RepID=UPI0026F1B5C5|nr:tyrosine--tRNA ligase [Candidatus Mycoplasma mahonii]WKX02692.1 tyrosine--tRNA ligase [Candidatus Mycoplasma mahonii]